MKTLLPPVALLSALLLLPAPPAAAQSPVAESVEVNLVLLDVTVLDAEGKPVSGLPKEAFRVEIGGTVLPVTYADEMRRSTAPAVPPPESLERGTVATAVAEPAVAPPRFLTVFVDSRNLRPGSRARALEALRNVILKAAPEDQMQLLDYTSNVDVITPWTNSKEALLAGVSRIQQRDAGGARRLMRQQLTWEEIRRSRTAQRRVQYVNAYAREVEVENRSLLSALGSTVDDLGGQPGRRALIFVTEGFELRPGEQLLELAVGRFGPVTALQRESSVNEVEALVRKSNAAGISIYSVDAAGLRGPEGLNAEFGTAPLLTGEGGVASKYNLTEGLMVLSYDTGGTVLIDTNALTPGLERIYEGMSSYYQLAIRLPAGARPGEYRKVKVSVASPGKEKVEVHAPRGWAAQGPAEKARRVIEAAFATQRPFRELTPVLDVRQSKASGLFSDAEVEGVLSLPASQLRPVPGAPAEFTIYFQTIDDRGRKSGVVEQAWRPVVSPGQPLRYGFRLKVREGNNRIFVGVWDPTSDRKGTVFFPIRVD